MAAAPKRLSAFPITPCDAAGRVDAAALTRLLTPLVTAGVDSIGLLGSTGSYVYLDRAERRRALETAVATVNGAVPILVGVGALRTDEAIRLAQDAKAIGATSGLLAPVSYTPLTADEVFTHFVAVAEASGLPLCIYDNPATTHFSVAPTLVERLSRVPGIVALKSPAPAPDGVAAHFAALRDRVPPHFSVGCSVDWHAGEALLAGADTWYSVAAGLFPDACLALARAADRSSAETRAHDARLAPLWSLFRRHTSLRTMFAAADILGICRAEPPRPILPLESAIRDEIARTLKALDLA